MEPNIVPLSKNNKFWWNNKFENMMSDVWPILALVFTNHIFVACLWVAIFLKSEKAEPRVGPGFLPRKIKNSGPSIQVIHSRVQRVSLTNRIQRSS